MFIWMKRCVVGRTGHQLYCTTSGYWTHICTCECFSVWKWWDLYLIITTWRSHNYEKTSPIFLFCNEYNVLPYPGNLMSSMCDCQTTLFPFVSTSCESCKVFIFFYLSCNWAVFARLYRSLLKKNKTQTAVCSPRLYSPTEGTSIFLFLASLMLSVHWRNAWGKTHYSQRYGCMIT